MLQRIRDWLVRIPVLVFCVVAVVTAGEVADLHAALNADHTKKFPEDRNLSAHFLEETPLPGYFVYGVIVGNRAESET